MKEWQENGWTWKTSGAKGRTRNIGGVNAKQALNVRFLGSMD